MERHVLGKVKYRQKEISFKIMGCFRNIYIVIAFCLVLTTVEAYIGTTDNYNLAASEVGLYITSNASTNYVLRGTVQDKYVGQNTSDSYNACIGYYCFIRRYLGIEEPVVTAAVEGGKGVSCVEGQVLLLGPKGYFCMRKSTYKKARDRSLITILILAAFVFIYFWLRKKDKDKELHEKKYYYDKEV